MHDLLVHFQKVINFIQGLRVEEVTKVQISGSHKTRLSTGIWGGESRYGV